MTAQSTGDTPAGDPEIRVLIADDHSLIRDSMSMILSLNGGFSVVATASDGEEALAHLRADDVDVAVLDIDMPGVGGLEVAETLHREKRPVAVVIVTSFGRPGYLNRAAQAGVRGFVTKDVAATRLVEVLRTVHAGGRVIDPEIATDAVTLGSNPLSNRELEVLRLARDGHSVAEVAVALSLTEGTTRNYLSAAMSKLGAANKIAAIRIATDAGWL